jgi:hypothetical protein
MASRVPQIIAPRHFIDANDPDVRGRLNNSALAPGPADQSGAA